jgi:ribonuclease D
MTEKYGDSGEELVPDSIILIEDSSELAAICESFSDETYITVDTEFMRESTYWPILCLVQIAGSKSAAVIDAMAPGIDLDPLLRLFKNRNILKVFHAGRQDLEIFYYLMGELPAPVFDTQVAAMVCGFGDSVGYDTLVAKLTRAKIDKSSRFTDWSARPLRPRQIEYAIGDVTHLRTVYEKLAALLHENGRESWLAEEIDTLTKPQTYDPDRRKVFQRIKTRVTSPRVLAVLREVAAWREEEAQTRNLPRNRLLRDESLLEIAHHAPKTVDDLARTRGLGRRMADGDTGQRILAAVARGVAVPDDKCPQPPAGHDRNRDRGPVTDLLKVLLKLRCSDAGVAQRLVASAEEVEVIAAQAEHADVPALCGWRREVFGEHALKFMRGKIALAANNGNLVTIVVDADAKVSRKP